MTNKIKPSDTNKVLTQAFRELVFCWNNLILASDDFEKWLVAKVEQAGFYKDNPGNAPCFLTDVPEMLNWVLEVYRQNLKKSEILFNTKNSQPSDKIFMEISSRPKTSTALCSRLILSAEAKGEQESEYGAQGVLPRLKGYLSGFDILGREVNWRNACFISLPIGLEKLFIQGEL